MPDLLERKGKSEGVELRSRRSGQGHRNLRADIKTAKAQGKRLKQFLKEKKEK